MQPSSHLHSRHCALHGPHWSKSFPNSEEVIHPRLDGHHASTSKSPFEDGNRIPDHYDNQLRSSDGLRKKIYEDPHSSIQRMISQSSEGGTRITQIGQGQEHDQHGHHGRCRTLCLHSYPSGVGSPKYSSEDTYEKPHRCVTHSTMGQFDGQRQNYTTNAPHFTQMYTLREGSSSGDLTTNFSHEKRNSIPLSTIGFLEQSSNPPWVPAIENQRDLLGMERRRLCGVSHDQTASQGCFAECCRSGRSPPVPLRFHVPFVTTRRESAGSSGNYTSNRAEREVRYSNGRRPREEDATRDELFPGCRSHHEGSHLDPSWAARRLAQDGVNPNVPRLATLNGRDLFLTDGRQSDRCVSRSRNLFTEGGVRISHGSNFDHEPQRTPYNAIYSGNYERHHQGHAALPKDRTTWQATSSSTSDDNQRQIFNGIHGIPLQVSEDVHNPHTSEANHCGMMGGKAVIRQPHSSSCSIRHSEWEQAVSNSKELWFHENQNQRWHNEGHAEVIGGEKLPLDEVHREQNSQLENKAPEGSDARRRDIGRPLQCFGSEDDAELPLLQEHLRVLLWALLGSEKLEAAAVVSMGRAGHTSSTGGARWCQTPVEDLLRAILGTCDFPECRRQQHFRDLAFEFLNKCPPLSERLAGHPRDLGAVVASVYHNDLMPSIRRHEGDFPEGVRRTVTRVARLELFLRRTPPKENLRRTTRVAQVKEEQEKQDETSNTFKDDQSLFSQKSTMKTAHKDIKSISKEGSQATRSQISKITKTCSSEYENGSPIINCPRSLHPHHQLLLKGIETGFRHHHIADGSYRKDDVHHGSMKDSEHSCQSNDSKKSSDDIIGDSPNLKMTGQDVRMKRKRGRPPKYNYDSNSEVQHGPVKREGRMVLWKFLLKLLDGDGNMKTRNMVPQSHYQNEGHLDCGSHSSHQETDTFDQEICNWNAKSENLSYETSLPPRGERLNVHGKDKGDSTLMVPPLKLNLASPMANTPTMKWICREEGLFQITDSMRLARLWGQNNQNPNMTYEKMSRAMRTYYHQKILMPVPRSYNLPKKLVYKFNPELLKKR